MNDQNPDNECVVVVVNEEGQYSVWAEGSDLPAGWRAEGTRGTKRDCLAHIAQVWKDMRPLSLRGA
jgi:MbtH protein